MNYPHNWKWINETHPEYSIQIFYCIRFKMLSSILWSNDDMNMSIPCIHIATNTFSEQWMYDKLLSVGLSTLNCSKHLECICFASNVNDVPYAAESSSIRIRMDKCFDRNHLCTLNLPHQNAGSVECTQHKQTPFQKSLPLTFHMYTLRTMCIQTLLNYVYD